MKVAIQRAMTIAANQTMVRVGRSSAPSMQVRRPSEMLGNGLHMIQ